MFEQPFSINVSPLDGDVPYQGKDVAVTMQITNTSSEEIALPLAKLIHSGLFLKFTNALAPDEFAYEPRCPGCDSPAETDESTVNLQPGTSVRFPLSISHWSLEQFSEPKQPIDVICEYTVKTKVLVGGEWIERRSTSSDRGRAQ